MEIRHGNILADRYKILKLDYIFNFEEKNLRFLNVIQISIINQWNIIRVSEVL